MALSVAAGIKNLFGGSESAATGGKGAYAVVAEEQKQVVGLPGDAAEDGKVELVEGKYYALKDPKVPPMY